MDLSPPEPDRSLARSARPVMALALCLTIALAACGSSGTKSPGAGGNPGTGGAAGGAGKGSGGSSSAGSGGSSSGGSGGSGSGGSSSSSGGSGGSSCAHPQLTFGRIGTGDTSPYFTTAAGARTATDLLVFNGYYGPAPGADAGSASLPYVYVQAFDPTTRASKGPAQMLFAVADPTREGMYVEAVAVAPTGQIALLYGHANNPLYAAFLAPATGADAGVAGLTVLQSNVVVGSTFLGVEGNGDSAHVFWSNATQAFVMSWVGDGVTESIAEFSATGDQVAGGVAAVRTDNGTTAGNVTESSAAASGDLLAIDWLSGISGKNQTGITVYDTSGSQVGGFTYVAPQVNGLAELAGTANGFVLVYAPQTGGLTTTGVFIPATASGLADAGTFPTYTISIPGGTAMDIRAISDNVGTAGAGGVGLALMGATSTSFAYVHADGITVDGPVSVFASGDQNSYSHVSLTNINGSFVMTVFQLTVNAGSGLPSMFSTQIAASGCN